MPSSSPIVDLIIAASVDATGIKRGLSEAEGFLRQFGRTADQELRESYAQFGRSGENAGSEAGLAIIGGLRAKLGDVRNVLTEQFARGVISQDEFKKLGTEAGQSYNQALLASIETLRGKNMLSPDMTGQLLGAMDKGALNAGAAMERAFGEQGSGGIAIAGMGRIRQGLTSLVASYTGTIPVLDRVGTTMLAMGAGGTVALGVVAGIALIAGAYHYATKEAKELEEANNKLVESFEKRLKVQALGAGGETNTVVAVLKARVAEQTAALNALLSSGQYTSSSANMGGGGPGMGGAGQSESAQKERADAEIVRQKEIARIRTEIAIGNAEIAEKERGAAARSLSDQVNGLAALIEAHKANAAQIRNARAEIQALDAAVNSMKANGATQAAATDAIALRDRLQAALDGKKDKQSTADPKPFKDLTSDVGELTRAIELAGQAGRAVGSDLYEKLVAKRAEIIAAMRDDPKAAQGTEGGNELQTALLDANNALGLSMDKIIAKYEATRAATGAWSIETTTAAANISRWLDGINDRILAQGGATKASTQLIKEQADGYAALARAIGTVKLPDSLARTLAADSMQGQAATVQQDNTVAAAMKASGSSGAKEAADAAIAARERLNALLRTSLETQQQIGESAEQYRARVAAAAALWAQINPQTTAIKDTFNEIVTAVHGIVDGMGGLGIIGPGITAAANGALHAATAIESMRKAKESTDGLSTVAALAGAVGVIGGVTAAVGGLISALSSNSATLMANNARLAELRAALEQPKGVGGDIAMETAIAAALKNPALTTKDGAKPTNFVDMQAFSDMLAKSGITMDQFKASAKALGIDFDGTRASLQAYDAALKLSIAAAQQFGKGLSDQQALQALHDQVYGKTSPADAIASTIKVLNQFAPQLGAGLSGINAATADGQAQLRAALRSLVDQLTGPNGIDPAKLGALGGAKDLAAIISSLQTNLDALSKSASGTVAALNYVPQGFKVALDRFNSMAPDKAATTPFTTTGGGGITNPQGPVGGGTQVPMSTGDYVSAMKAGSGSGAGPTYNIASMSIDAKQMSSTDLFASVLKVAQRRSQTTFGRSDMWANVQTPR